MQLVLDVMAKVCTLVLFQTIMSLKKEEEEEEEKDLQLMPPFFFAL
jgi:hypothetical protein